jgi:hypothetical protein
LSYRTSNICRGTDVTAREFLSRLSNFFRSIANWFRDLFGFKKTPPIEEARVAPTMGHLLSTGQENTVLSILNEALSSASINNTKRKNLLKSALVNSIFYHNHAITELCLKHLSNEEISEYVQEPRIGATTALNTAVHVGNVSLIKDLLKRNVDVNYIGEIIPSALYAAIAKGGAFHKEVINLLLSHGAKLNTKTLDLIEDAKKRNFKFDFEKIPYPIHFFDGEEPKASHAGIRKQIQEHNEKLRKQAVEQMKTALPTIPTDVINIVADYHIGPGKTPVPAQEDIEDSEKANSTKPKGTR